MAHFAHVDPTSKIVCQVIVISEELIAETNGWFCPKCKSHKNLPEWVQTSYNTHAGTHKLGGIPLRKNYAGIGYTYDAARDAFIPPKKYDSWVLNEVKCVFEPPIEYPKDGKSYVWNEKDVAWVEVQPPIN